MRIWVREGAATHSERLRGLLAVTAAGAAIYVGVELSPTIVALHAAGAVRKVSVERGVDPRTLALVAFGGAGPLHACALAEALGMPAVDPDLHLGDLGAVIFTGGFRPDYARWIKVPGAFDDLGFPVHGWEDNPLDRRASETLELRNGDVLVGIEEIEHVVRTRLRSLRQTLGLSLEELAARRARGSILF